MDRGLLWRGGYLLTLRRNPSDLPKGYHYGSFALLRTYQ